MATARLGAAGVVECAGGGHDRLGALDAGVRHGAFYLFPPPALAGPLDELRERHDPRSAAICGAHVSLTEPLPRAPTEADLEELAAACRSVPSFELHLGSPRSPTPHPGVVLDVTPRERVEGLRDALHAVRLFDGVSLTRRAVPPHLTIVEFVTLDDAVALAAVLADEVAPSSFVCDRVVLAVPDASFRFRHAAVLWLGGGSAASS